MAHENGHEEVDECHGGYHVGRDGRYLEHHRGPHYEARGDCEEDPPREGRREGQR